MSNQSGSGNSAKADGGEMANAGAVPEAEPPRELTPAAVRALAEAEERRQAAAEAAAAASVAGTGPAREVGGRAGPDPIRYGDWEKGGIASDF